MRKTILAAALAALGAPAAAQQTETMVLENTLPLENVPAARDWIRAFHADVAAHADGGGMTPEEVCAFDGWTALLGGLDQETATATIDFIFQPVMPIDYSLEGWLTRAVGEEEATARMADWAALEITQARTMSPGPAVVSAAPPESCAGLLQ
jgi:hypothetical protein